MGYESTLYGTWRIEPPLRWGEYKDSPHCGVERARENHKAVYLVQKVEDVETDDGPLTRRTAVEVAYAWPHPEKLYDLIDELQALVNAHPDHEFVGRFDGQGADFGDLWRVYVDKDRKVRRMLPRITWPDGETMRSRYEDGG